MARLLLVLIVNGSEFHIDEPVRTSSWEANKTGAA